MGHLPAQSSLFFVNRAAIVTSHRVHLAVGAYLLLHNPGFNTLGVEVVPADQFVCLICALKFCDTDRASDLSKDR
jgi:hypothetical protein